MALACLEKVLRLDPHNQRAKSGLDWARQRLVAASHPQPVTKANLQHFVYVADDLDPTPVPTEKPAENLKAEQPSPVTQPKTVTPDEKKSNSKQTLNYSRPIPANRKPASETLDEAVPYKKSRLQSNQSSFTAVELPPEALKKANQTEKSKTFTPLGSVKKLRMPESAAFRAAKPKVAVSVSERVAQSLNGDYTLSERQSRLSLPPVRVATLLFSGAILLAVLSFILVNFAPLLGILAIILAVSGVILFNQSGTKHKE